MTTENRIPNSTSKLDYLVFFKSLLYSWVSLIIGISLVIYFYDSQNIEFTSTNPIIKFLGSLWKVADEIGPAVKLSLVLILGFLTFSFTQFNFMKTCVRLYFFSAAFGVVSVFTILVAFPENLSRGFGIGLVEERLLHPMVPLYLLVGFLGGLVFAICYIRLNQKISDNKYIR